MNTGTNGDAVDDDGSSSTSDQEHASNNRRRGRRQQQQRQCEQCKMNDAIYQCPKCMLRTCSLQCCVAHKQNAGCSGKRNRSEFLPLSGMNESTLRSDYFFLEEVLEQVPRASKIAKTDTDYNGHGSSSKKQSTMNKKSRRLVQQAERRSITLRTMPPVMERHKRNTSWYCGPRDMIIWKVEVILHPTKQIINFDLSENEENILILQHILKHLSPSGGISGISNNYKLFIKRPSAANKPRYIEMKPHERLRKALEGLTIIEHPTIYCVPNDETHLKEFPIGTEEILEDTTTTSSLSLMEDITHESG